MTEDELRQSVKRYTIHIRWLWLAIIASLSLLAYVLYLRFAVYNI